MNTRQQKKVMENFFTTKAYITYLLIFIVYYSFKQRWDIVFILCVLFMVFIQHKKKLKKKMLEPEEVQD